MATRTGTETTTAEGPRLARSGVRLRPADKAAPPPRPARAPRKAAKLAPAERALACEIRALIAQARAQVTGTVNAALTMLYWRIGQRIHTEVLQGQRAGYGREILATLSQDLTAEFGNGYSYSALTRMARFAEAFPDAGVVGTLAQTLSWSHFTALLPLDKPMQRDFYAEMCRLERWSVRMLRSQVDSMLYERTALAREPQAVVQAQIGSLRQADAVSPALVLKDPYVLDFLGLKDCYLEKDLEDAILRELESFLLELGAGFSFVARQKRLQIDSDDFYIDLLFFNRKLRRLVAIELKLGDFKAEYKGQMELYLRWLAKHEQQAGEASPLGIILCTGKKREQIELLALDNTGIHVAEYLTELPPKAMLQRKLQEALATSQARLESQQAHREDAQPASV